MSSGSSPEVRIGDAERDAAVSALGEHYAAGRLDKDEYDERAAGAWAARTASDLRPLFADLPAPNPLAPPRGRGVAATSLPHQQRPAAPSRSAGWRLPLFPMLFLALALAIIVGKALPVFLIVGGLWWMSRSFGRQRRSHGCGWHGHDHAGR